jgi:hypothetical protein
MYLDYYYSSSSFYSFNLKTLENKFVNIAEKILLKKQSKKKKKIQSYVRKRRATEQKEKVWTSFSLGVFGFMLLSDVNQQL